jgi:transcriptional regulator with XRE-family HTH domain
MTNLPRGEADPVQLIVDRVAERIRYYRRLKRWDQRELSARAGMSVHSLSFLERGKSAMTVRSLVRIALALGVRPQELLQAPKSQDDVAPRYGRGYQPRNGQLKAKRKDGGKITTQANVDC